MEVNDFHRAHRLGNVIAAHAKKTLPSSELYRRAMGGEAYYRGPGQVIEKFVD